MIFSPVPGSIPADYHVAQGFGSNAPHYAKYGLNGHNGIDLGIPSGTPLRSPCDGYVHCGDEGGTGYGKFVKITNYPSSKGEAGREITLGHLSRFIFGLEGKYIHAGEIVGISGNTGDSTGPHVHITYKQIDMNGKILNGENGYHGALDVSAYIELWSLGNVLRM